MKGAIGWVVLFAALAFGAAFAVDFHGLQRAILDERPRHAVTPAWYLDASGYDGAEAEQKSAQAPMLVYFHKRVCEPCRKFEHEVLGPAKPQLASVVKVRVDVDAGDREKQLAKRFGVESAPGLALVPADGTPRALPLPKTSRELAALTR